MKLTPQQRALLRNGGLVALGIIVGIVLVTEFSSVPIASIFGQGVRELGAKQPPVKMPENVRALNEAFVAAANAVLPTVVSIEVTGTARDGMPDLDDFFRFFDPWGDEFFFGPRDKQRNERRQERQRPRPLGMGSGVIITSDGYIVTNNHVVAGASEGGIKVTLYDRREFTAKLVGRDSLLDIAVIKIDAQNLPVAYLGTRDDIRVGDWVIAVGNPLQLRSTVTAGIISAVGRGGIGLNRGGFAIDNYIQTDAAINPGNSGGGLFTLNGTLIGINTAIVTGTGYFNGYGFAIPIDIVRVAAMDLINYGKVNRAYLGVTIRSVDETDAKGFGLPKIEGVVVQDVLDNSPAQKAGIKPGDVILDVDGTTVNSPNELQTLILQRRPGDRVTLRIWRDGKAITKEVRLEARDGAVAAAASRSSSNDNSSSDSGTQSNVTFEDLGFSVGPLTEQIKEELKVDSGVLVTDVDSYSEAQQRGLTPNSVIISADRKEVKSPAELRAIIASKKPGEVVVLQVKNRQGRQIISLRIPNKVN